ncbi:jg13621 [Pararge aegeria aegeria]|uniref:Jg13621 protein n=1 Tax=Pararge aegeria aegeria TaxID=348720 RepID=A0A8S4QYW3_9NEOP|nr:jg13621 [Pararge aegeria aegeria]
MRSFSGNKLKINNYKESLVHIAINKKIEELKPFLQDSDVISNEEKFTLEDHDDTTIIEFLPKTEEHNQKTEDDSFKSNLKDYKKLKEKINKALTKEAVSMKTKDLVVKTLDGLIKSLLRSQCKWKRNLRAVKSENPSDIARKWNSGLQRIKEVILDFVKNKSVNSRRNDDVLNILNAILIMFRSVSENVDIISKNYRILCDFIPKESNNYVVKSEETNAGALRNNWDKTDLEEVRCHIVVCSDELKEFMINFYQSLNETAVSVLNNYVEMYTKDVNADNESEKKVIISLLNNISRNLEKDISKVFVKETKELGLHEGKNNQANIKAMSSYVINTIKSVKYFAKQLLKSELLVLRENIFSIIFDDLNVNLDVDLGNLERDFLSKICTTFRFCNGRYRGRRQGSNNLNKNNLYVQLKLTFDDDITNSYRKFLNLASSKYSHFIQVKSSKTNFIATRTTLMNNVNNHK